MYQPFCIRFLAPPLLLALFLALAIHGALAATTFVVGGASGWALPSQTKVNYEQWASSITFKVGDYVEFNYPKQDDSVLEVIRSDFRYCNLTNPIASFQDGKTVIELSKLGSYYFISGIPGHCKAGEKFQLKVVAGSSSVASTPAMEPAVAPESGHAVAPTTGSASTFGVSLTLVWGLLAMMASLVLL